MFGVFKTIYLSLSSSQLEYFIFIISIDEVLFDSAWPY